MSANRSDRNPSKKLELHNTRKSPHVIWCFEHELKVDSGKEQDCNGHSITKALSKFLCKTHTGLVPSKSNIIECDPHEDLYEPLNYGIDWSVELKQKFVEIYRCLIFDENE